MRLTNFFFVLLFWIFAFFAFISIVQARDEEVAEATDPQNAKNLTHLEKHERSIPPNTTTVNKTEMNDVGPVNRTETKPKQRDIGDDFVELNPDYVGDSSDTQDEYDEYDSEEEEEQDRKPSSKKSSKSAVDSALANSGSMPQRTRQFIKKNRVKITLVVALLAFRKEIGGFLMNKIAPAVGKDPKTGEVIHRIQPTSIIKIIVFIDVMWQLQAAGKKTQSPILVALLLLGANNPFLGAMISKMLFSENNSFVPPVEQHYTFERVNDRYQKDCLALQKAANVKKKDAEISLSSLSILREPDSTKNYTETVIVLDLTKIESGWRMEMLRDEVSFLIHQHREKSIVPYGTADKMGRNATNEVEVLVLLESPGGGASDFALASQHILRLRNEPGITVTISVDKIAASGGYMIACASSPGRLFAAPFAIVGSIGVIGQTVNIQKMLEGWGMKPMVFRSGKDKSPVNLIGEVSDRDMKQIQGMVDETHEAFKRHVAHARPRVAKQIDVLATGRVWLGYNALKIGLVDRIVTSDEYIGERIQDGARLLKLMKNPRKHFMFGASRRRADEPMTNLGSCILSSIKEYAQAALMSLAKNTNLVQNDNEGPLSFRAGLGQVSARADAAYSFSSPDF